MATAVNGSRPLRCSIQSMSAPTASVWFEADSGREKLSAWSGPFTWKVDAAVRSAQSRPPESVEASSLHRTAQT